MPNTPPDWLDQTLLNGMVRPCWKLPNSTALLSSEALEGDILRLEWCGGIFHPRDQAVEQGEWIFHHWVAHKGLYNKTPKLNAQEQ